MNQALHAHMNNKRKKKEMVTTAEEIYVLSTSQKLWIQQNAKNVFQHPSLSPPKKIWPGHGSHSSCVKEEKFWLNLILPHIICV
jgi:hypothetical protein